MGLALHGYAVRSATELDLVGCNALCRRVFGHDRNGELVEAIARRSAKVVKRQGRISGYTIGIGHFAHSVAESNDDLAALIGAADEFSGPGFWYRCATPSYCAGACNMTYELCTWATS